MDLHIYFGHMLCLSGNHCSVCILVYIPHKDPLDIPICRCIFHCHIVRLHHMEKDYMDRFPVILLLVALVDNM